MPSHPFAWLDEPAQRRALPLLIALALLLVAVMAGLGEPLRSPEAPRGILDFELAGSAARAGAIVDSWSPRARLYAALGLGLDYLFLVAYSAAVALACVRAAARLEPRAPAAAAVGRGLAWAQPLAAALDASENYGLIRLLLGDGRELWARLALACAIPKFALVFAGILFALGAGAIGLLRRD